MISAKEARERSLSHEKHLKAEIDHIEKVIFREIEQGRLNTTIVLPDKDVWNPKLTSKLIDELESYGYKVTLSFSHKRLDISWKESKR